MNLYTLTTSCLQEIKPKTFKLEKETLNLAKVNQKLTLLRVGLFPMLMNGQVKVGDMKGYEEKGEVRVTAEESEKYGNFNQT
jgi:hypothetical protein